MEKTITGLCPKIEKCDCRMIVAMATAVVWVLLHNETDKNVRKTAILGRFGNIFLGRGLTVRFGRFIRNIGTNILIR